MAGPSKGQLQIFFNAFGRWLEGGGDPRALTELITLYDRITAEGERHRPVGRPPHLREPGPEGTWEESDVF